MGTLSLALAALATSSALNAPPVLATHRCAWPRDPSLSHTRTSPLAVVRPSILMGGFMVVSHSSMPAAAA
eukprot:8261696-Heterocapsa_arctica.AAC.1